MQESERFQRSWLGAAGLAALLLAGCGGGGDDGPSGMTAAASAGIWTGTTSTDRQVTAILLSDGEYHVVYSGVDAPGKVGGVVRGEATVGGGRFDSTDAVDYSLEGAGAAAGGIEARITPYLFRGTLRPGTGTEVEFLATRSAASAAVPTLAALAGDYPGEVAFSLGTRPATFSVTAAGAVRSVINACDITGTVAPRTDTNAYDLAITFGGAPCVFPNLTFTGAAHYAGGQLVASVRNTAIRQAIVFSGTR